MTAKEAIIRHFLSRMEITALVDDRIRPNKARQGETLPYLVVTSVGADPTYHAGGDSGLQMSGLRVKCFGATETEASQVAETVRKYTSGKPRGLVGDLFVSGVFVRSISDSSQAPVSGDEVGYPCVAIDFDVWHSVETNDIW